MSENNSANYFNQLEGQYLGKCRFQVFLLESRVGALGVGCFCLQLSNSPLGVQGQHRKRGTSAQRERRAAGCRPCPSRASGASLSKGLQVWRKHGRRKQQTRVLRRPHTSLFYPKVLRLEVRSGLSHPSGHGANFQAAETGRARRGGG